MNPTPLPNSSDKDETALSGTGPGAVSGAADSTDAGTPTDVTVVRSSPSARTIADAPGANSFGKYELLGEVARGGMGVVYRARQPGLDRTVALKMILGTGINAETAQRFLQEARAAAALDHPNVVPIYDIGELGENGDRAYFTMALIDGPNLRAHVETMGTVPISTAIALFAQIVAGVAHAHQHGIIHRDLKPANVLIDRDGRPRVTDFGLAKRVTTDSQLTATGQVVGTPSYMAPEQARDSKDVGPPADVYALGAILYFLLTGKPPFQGESFTDLLIKVVSEPPVPPSHIRPDVPGDLEELCMRCLTKTPAERFPDADALAAALVPIADQHLTPSTGLARVGSRPSTPVVGSVPDLTPTTNFGPALASASSLNVPAETPPNRRPLVFGLAGFAVLLVGAIVYLATRDKKDEVAKQDPPPAPAVPAVGTPGSSGVTPSVPNIGAPTPAPAVPPTGTANKLAWPAPTRADFGLKVALVSPVAKKGADGLQLFPNGTELEVHITAERDCRVSIWILDATGEMRLFPNDSETDDRLIAGQKRVIPSKNGRPFAATPTVGDVDRLRVLATTGDRHVFPEGAKQSEYTVYANAEDRERLASTVRGIVLKQAGSAGSTGAVSEAEIRFHVQK